MNWWVPGALLRAGSGCHIPTALCSDPTGSCAELSARRWNALPQSCLVNPPGHPSAPSACVRVLLLQPQLHKHCPQPAQNCGGRHLRHPLPNNRHRVSGREMDL